MTRGPTSPRGMADGQAHAGRRGAPIDDRVIMNVRRLVDDRVRGIGAGARVPVSWLDPVAPVDPGGYLRLGLAGIAGGGLLLTGLVLVVRRASTDLAPPTPAVVVAAGVAVWSLLKLTDAALCGEGPKIVPIAARIGLIAAVGALVTAPAATGAADWVARGGVVVATLVALVGRRARAALASPVRDSTRLAHGVDASALPGPRTPRRRPPAGALRQRLERFERTDGTDTLRGTIVVGIPAGAKAGHGHVGFCPSFAALPTVRVSTEYDGADATVSVAEILPWGVRVECRLADPAEERVEIPVTVSASLAPTVTALP